MNASDRIRRERELMPQDALPMLDHRADFPAIDKTISPPIVRRLGLIAAVLFFGYVILVLVLPWQQFVSGSGRVVAFDPLERPQVLEAPLSGRIVASYVVEGEEVKAGDVLFEMADNDPKEAEVLTLCAKVFCTEAAETVTGMALRILSGDGYRKGTAAEQAYRCAKYGQIAGVSTEIARVKIGNAALGKM
jgi:multidrug efflux pump subunit AcrA (membrane-fusion protein)